MVTQDGNQKENLTYETCLANTFPSLFSVARNKSVPLGNNSLPIEEASQFRRRLFDRGVEQLQTLKHLLFNCDITTTANRADQIEWRGCTSKLFSVKSIYSLCGDNESITDPIYKFIWKNIAPHNTKCFGWLVVKGRVKTGDYLHRLGIIHSVDGALCKFCNEHIETMDHFLLLCTPVWSIWTRLLAWIGIQWVVPPNLLALLTWWFHRKLKPKLKMIWDCIPFAVFWTLRLKRNGASFDNEALDWNDILELIKLKSYYGQEQAGGSTSYTTEDFLFVPFCKLASEFKNLGFIFKFRFLGWQTISKKPL